MRTSYLEAPYITKTLQIASSRNNGADAVIEGPFVQMCAPKDDEGGANVGGGGFVKKCCGEGEIIVPDERSANCVNVSSFWVPEK